MKIEFNREFSEDTTWTEIVEHFLKYLSGVFNYPITPIDALKLHASSRYRIACEQNWPEWKRVQLAHRLCEMNELISEFENHRKTSLEHRLGGYSGPGAIPKHALFLISDDEE